MGDWTVLWEHATRGKHCKRRLDHRGAREAEWASKMKELKARAKEERRRHTEEIYGG